ncbi:MAG TPA: hypothetical protein VFD92_03840 [Candidatus Binatia bacterium]|nr:hypothetical protein [Candidatus Binatia bacterium]
MIFEKHSCTQDVCHGSSAQGGLELTPDVAYQNLIEVPSQGIRYPRVVPGDKNRSYLWLKLAAATLPGSVEINGAPMPNGLPPISTDELEALRLWIYAGAPETGTVGGTETLLNACLPAPEPITIKPLDPPAAGEGIQLVMPPWHLEAHSEHEYCFATYYDITDQVPAEYRDPSGKYFRWKSFELRQDPQSHHLILYMPAGNFSAAGVDVHDPSFGAWTCIGGEREGASCEPTDLTSCGTGICRSEPKPTFACINYGPEQGASIPVGGAQQAQALNDYPDGVFAQIPMKGVVYWNTHAFNLTAEDTMMHSRLNYNFAKEQVYPITSIFDASRIFAANAAPYTTQTVCNDFVLPQGARLFQLTSHTHKHGKHFTVDLMNGTRLYDSFVYNDPVQQKFEPALLFDSPNRADRTLHYCSLYNNGVNEDGSPNPETVTRASRVPASASQTIGRCRPVACSAGNVGAPCNGSDDRATCDSSPGAGDGECDACRITGGESTENEMFILFGAYYLAPVDGGQSEEGVASLGPNVLDANGRSLWSEPALPGNFACSAGGHGAHGAQTAEGLADATAHSGHARH